MHSGSGPSKAPASPRWFPYPHDSGDGRRRDPNNRLVALGLLVAILGGIAAIAGWGLLNWLIGALGF